MIEVGRVHPGSKDEEVEFVDVDGVRVGIVAERWEKGSSDILLVTQEWKLHGPRKGQPVKEYVLEQLYWRALETIALVAQGYEPLSVEQGDEVIWERKV